MSPIAIVVTIAAGAAASALRYGVSHAFTRLSSAENFPWAVLIVNVVGSAIGGITLGLAHNLGVSAELQLILLTGVCGGLTTFSTFSVETIQLITHGRWRAATLSTAANLILGFGVCLLGYLLFVV